MFFDDRFFMLLLHCSFSPHVFLSRLISPLVLLLMVYSLAILILWFPMPGVVPHFVYVHLPMLLPLYPRHSLPHSTLR